MELDPSQITVGEATADTVGVVLTVTVAVVVPVQEPEEPVTVYTVVTEGLAVTVEPLTELSPVAGDQV